MSIGGGSWLVRGGTTHRGNWVGFARQGLPQCIRQIATLSCSVGARLDWRAGRCPYYNNSSGWGNPLKSKPSVRFNCLQGVRQLAHLQRSSYCTGLQDSLAFVQFCVVLEEGKVGLGARSCGTFCDESLDGVHLLKGRKTRYNCDKVLKHYAHAAACCRVPA